MLKKVIETTASAGLGDPPSRKLFKVTDGEYAGRLVAIMQTSPDEIILSWADSPYMNWCDPIITADDAAHASFDAAVDENGNVWIVYAEASTLYLVSRKLTFSGGTWSVGTKSYIYSGSVSAKPSVSVEATGKLWVSWSLLSGGYYDIQVKTSDDGGLTWGSGSLDPGDALRAGLTEGSSRVAIAPSGVYVIYTGTGSDIMVRSQPRSGGEWSSELTIASGVGIDENYDASVSDDGLLGVVFDSGQLRYREFDGSNWGSTVTLDDNEAICPQVSFMGNIPVVTYLSDTGSGQRAVKCVHRRTGSFSNPEILDNRTAYFDSVILYESGSSSYADVTDAASTATAADMVHPSSGSSLKAVGDCMYVGMDSPYRFMTFLLATPGVGGSVSYSYFDGLNWKSFTPAGGGFSLDTSEKAFLLWDDYNGIPADWQACSVDGVTRFWIRVDVVSAFSTGPVGSMLTAITNVQAISVRR